MKAEIIQVLASFVGSFGFAVLYNLRGRKLCMAGISGMVSWIASATSSSFLRYADAILYMHCKCSSISLQKASLSSFFALRIKNSLFIDFSILLSLTGHQEMLCKSLCLCASTY